MDKRTMIAVVLSFLVFLVFTFLGEKYGSKETPKPPAPKTAETTKPATPAPAQPAAKPSAAPQEPEVKPQAPPQTPAARPSRPAREVVVETDLYRAVFTEQGASLISFQLKKYWQRLPFETISRLGIGPVSLDIESYRNPNLGAKPKELVTAEANQELPLSLSWESRQQTVPPDLFYEASAPSLKVEGDGTGTLTFKGVTPAGLEVTKTYRFKGQSYAFDMKATVANHTSQNLEGKLNLALTGISAEGGQESWSLAAYAAKSLEEFAAGKLEEPKVFSDKVEWVGLNELYFLTAAVPQGTPQVQAKLQEPRSNQLQATLVSSDNLPVGQKVQASYAFYFGPKDINNLQAADLGLDMVVDFGWFDWLARPFLYVIKWLNGFFHNYGWTLIVLTILLRLVFWWPNHKSFQSMKVMQKIQPRVAEIREKHKDDKEAMNRELMNLYRTFKVNPLGGLSPHAPAVAGLSGFI